MSDFLCDEDLECDDIDTGNGCDEKGVTSAYYIPRKELNLKAMTDAAATYIDSLTLGCKLLGFAFNGVKRFKRLGFDIENSFYNSTKADENADTWNHTITNFFKGKSPEQTLALKKLSAACGGLVVVVFTESCQARVFGLEWSNKSCRFKWYFSGMKEGAATDTHGQFGQAGDARDEFDLVGRSKCRALWLENGDEKTFVNNYTS